MRIQSGLKGQCLDYIRKHGSARSTELGEKFGADSSTVSATLAAAVESGELVSCKVISPKTSRPCNEYRIGSGLRPAGTPLVDPKTVPHVIDPAPDPNPDTPGDSEGGETDQAAPAASPDDPDPICSIDSGGRLHLKIGSHWKIFGPAETREIGQLLVDSEPAWN